MVPPLMSCAAILAVCSSCRLSFLEASVGVLDFLCWNIEQYAGTALVRYTQVCGEFFLTPLSDSLYRML